MKFDTSQVISTTFQVVVPIGGRVKMLACFTNLFEAVDFAETYTRYNQKPAFICRLQIVYATAGGAQ